MVARTQKDVAKNLSEWGCELVTPKGILRKQTLRDTSETEYQKAVPRLLAKSGKNPKAKKIYSPWLESICLCCRTPAAEYGPRRPYPNQCNPRELHRRQFAAPAWTNRRRWQMCRHILQKINFTFGGWRNLSLKW